MVSCKSNLSDTNVIRAGSGSGSGSASGEGVNVADITMNSWEGPYVEGALVSDCMGNPTFNLCLIPKDPVSANGAAFSPRLGVDTSNSTIEREIMSFALIVPETGTLSNSRYRVIPPNGTLAQSDANGDWKFTIRGDEDHKLAQVSSFYWINYQREYMLARTGTWQFNPTNFPIVTMGTSNLHQNNAFYDTNSIQFGYRNEGQNLQAVALDAAVAAHEQGHALLDNASMSGFGAQTCDDINGCWGAIHEGFGDVMSFMLFRDNGVLGLYFANSLDGLRAPEYVKDLNLNSAYFYDLIPQAPGQIHAMGNVIASIFWEVYEKHALANNEVDIEILFVETLSTIGNQDNFTTLFDALSAVADQVLPGKAAEIMDDFRVEYQRMGVTVN